MPDEQYTTVDVSDPIAGDGAGGDEDRLIGESTIVDGEAEPDTTVDAASDDGLAPRVEVAKQFGGDGDSGWRPFWDYDQESLDAAAISWTADTNVDGSLAALYIQAPYGYQADVLGAEQSTILSKIADSMRSNGHPDWADAVTADRVSTIDWRSGNCQTFGLSYSPAKRIDPVKLTALCTDDPYHVTPFDSEWMSEKTTDEDFPARPTDSPFWAVLAAGGVLLLGGGVLATLAAFTVADAAVEVVKGTRWKKKRAKAMSEMARPGYILETTGGWLVWQYDWPTAGMSQEEKQKWLAANARKQVDDWILKKYADSPVSPMVVDTAVSGDGRLTWLRSDVKLSDAQCELSPYQAEQYLSLYVRHQSNESGLPGREYGKDKPTVIMSTVGDAAIPSGRPDAVSMGEWTADGAVKRAMAAMEATSSSVAVDSDPEQSALQATDPIIELDEMVSKVETLARLLMSKSVASDSAQSVDAVCVAADALKTAGKARGLMTDGSVVDVDAARRLTAALSRWEDSLESASKLIDAVDGQASPFGSLLTAVSPSPVTSSSSPTQQNGPWTFTADDETATDAGEPSYEWPQVTHPAGGAGSHAASLPAGQSTTDSRSASESKADSKAGSSADAGSGDGTGDGQAGSSATPVNPFRRRRQ